MPEKNRLTPKRMTINPEYMSDHLTLLAHNIESSLLFQGAKPNQDYTYKDLMDWAVQLSGDKADELKCAWDEPL
jgi:hypothetical protein